MTYTVVAIPKDKQYEDIYDATTYDFFNLEQALNFMKLAILSSSDAIFKIEKNGE